MGKIPLSFIVACGLVFAAGCGTMDSAASLPYPTKVEYADGKVSGSIALLTGRSVTFVARDAEGNPADAGAVTVVMTRADGSATDKEYGSCETSEDNPSEIICRTPDTMPDDPNPRVRYTFIPSGAPVVKNGDEVTVPKESRLARFTGHVVVSPEAVDGGKYEFTRMLELPGCRAPGISSNGAGWVFLTCLSRAGHKKSVLNLYWSSDDGATWTGPSEIPDVSNMNIVRAKRITGGKKTSEAIIAYNAHRQMNIVEISGDADGNISIGPAHSAYGKVYDAHLDRDGGVHIVGNIDSTPCPGYQPKDGIANAYYMKLVDGTFSEGMRINDIDCSVKADRNGYPRIASSGSGAVHVAWRSIEDSEDAEPSTISMHVSEIDPAGDVISHDGVISSFVEADAGEVWASGQHATTDRDGNLIVSWGEASLSAGEGSMRVYISLFEGADTFASYLMDEIADIDTNNPYEASGTSVIPDYAKGYHMFYRDGDDLVYVLGELTPSGMVTTRPTKISSADRIARGQMRTDTDWSGKNFLAWQEGKNNMYATIVAVGAMK